ncbi:MAG: YraN family protein [Patescibacteria group bacterium]
MDQRREFGNRGEDLAAVFFELRGFRVVARNWNCRLGEIDLIVERAGVTHFVEVKTRRGVTYGNPEEAITQTKLQHLAKAIELYLRACPEPPADYRVDALAILAIPGQKPEFHYIENIL